MPPLERSHRAQPCSSVSWEQNGYYAAQDFICVREFIKTESVTAVQRAFRLRFNIQPPTRKSICRRWNHQFEQIGCLCPSFWITLYIRIQLVPHSKYSPSPRQRPVLPCCFQKYSVFTERITWHTHGILYVLLFSISRWISYYKLEIISNF